MKMRMILAVLLSQLALTLAAFGDTERAVSIPGHKIKITVPAGYSFKVDHDEDGNARVVMENPVWEISITALLITEPDPKIGTQAWQEEKVVTLMADALAQSKEKDYKFQKLHPQTGSGTFCIFTDETLKPGDPHKPGDYVHMVGGVKALRGCVVGFTIMCNDLTTPEYQEAFGLFENSFSE